MTLAAFRVEMLQRNVAQTLDEVLRQLIEEPSIQYLCGKKDVQNVFELRDRYTNITDSREHCQELHMALGMGGHSKETGTCQWDS